MNIQWNADKYTNDFSFVHKYGNDLLQLIDKKENLRVLDLGCGNGALTKKLNDIGMNVIGIDASIELLEIARGNYPELEFLQADATDFQLAEKVDIIFSNAVFHWIDKNKQKQMLECAYQSLNDNGQFVFEFGGFGNNQLIHTALKRVFEEQGLDYQMPFYFPTIGQYTSLLEQVGFKVTYAVLFDRMTELSGDNGLADWIKMFVKIPFKMVKAEQQTAIINQVVLYLKNSLCHNGIWYADYVRIRCKAIK